MPITKQPDWNTLANRPSTVAGLGLSDFNASAIAAQAGMTVGAVGTYGYYLYNVAATLAIGATVAGSTLNKLDTAAANVSAGLTGTWRHIGARENQNGLERLFIRTA